MATKKKDPAIEILAEAATPAAVVPEKAPPRPLALSASVLGLGLIF